MSAARNVLILVQNLSVPFDRRVWQEALALSQSGLRVIVVCPRMADRAYSEILEGIQIYRYPQPISALRLPGFFLEYGWALILMCLYTWFVCLRHGFRVLHLCNPPDFLFLLALPFKLFGAKVVFEQLDLCPEMYRAKFGAKDKLIPALLRLCERLTYRTANLVISPNQSYRDVAHSRGCVPLAKIRIVRTAPDENRFKETKQNPSRRHGRRWLVAYVGIMGQQDGVDGLLRIIRNVVRQSSQADILFTLMGGGENLANLKKLADELELAEHVLFTGFIPDSELCEILSTADLCVAPDPKTPFTDVSSMCKIVEYMAIGKPIVSYDLRESRYTAGESAVYVKEMDEQAFAREILRLLLDESARASMSKVALARFRSHLSWSISVKNLINAYDSLLSCPKRLR